MIKRLMFVVMLLVPITANAQYDSLSEYRDALRLLTSESSASMGLKDSMLTIVLNLAARQVQVQTKQSISIDSIRMLNNVLRYQLDTKVMHGDVSVVIWYNRTTKVERAAGYVAPEKLGHIIGPAAPVYYTVVGDWLIINRVPAVDDTLYVYYAAKSTEMSGVNDTAGLDETDDAAVVFLAASFVHAMNHQDFLAQFWYARYKEYLEARTWRPASVVQ